MKCNKCGTPFVENGIFCPNCGERCDGKTKCENCDQLIDVSSVFCPFCGIRLDGKTECTNCGKFFSGTFCTYCGKSHDTPIRSGKQSLPNVFSFLEIKKFLLPTLMLCTLLVLFICSFFVGYAGFANDGTGNYEFVKVNSFYFFNDAYKELNQVFDTLSLSVSAHNYPYMRFFVLFPYIVNTVFVATNLVFSLTTLIFGGIKFYRALKLKQPPNLCFITSSSFAVFFCTSLFVLFSSSVDGMKLSSGSIVGVLVGGIFILCTVLIKLINNAKILLSENLLGKLINAIVIFSLSFVCILLLKAVVKEYPKTEIVHSSSLCLALSGALLSLINKPIFTLECYNNLSSASLYGFCFYIILFILLCILIASSIYMLLSSKQFSLFSLVCGSLIALFSIGYFITSIIIDNCFSSITLTTNSDTIFSIATVPSLIFSLILLTCTIIQFFLVKKRN